MRESQQVYQNKRVVLITGAASKWYEQAIFVVRKNAPPSGVDVVAEAERIIEAYMAKDGPARPAAAPTAQKPRSALKGGRGIWTALNAVTLISLCAVFAMLAYRFLS